MPIGTGAEVRRAIILESVYGTTPSSPAFAVLRTTGGGLRSRKTTQVSDEIQADRNVRDEAMTGLDVEGNLPFELSYASFDTLIEAVLKGAWTTNVVKNGVTDRSFTVEETIELGATDSYRRFDGCVVDALTLSLTAREKITGEFRLMGRRETLATAALGSATYTAPNTKAIMTASGSVGTLTVGALSPQPTIRSLSLQIENGHRRRPVVASLYGREPGRGMCQVTGTLEAYFESNALYAAALAHETAAITATLGEVTNEKYTIELPLVRFGDAEVTAGGQNDDVMARIPFRAIYDATAAASIVITRAVA